MAKQHYSLGGVTDPHPVRPGTSDALTARTIDATVHPPIVRARDAVVAIIPRVAAPLSSPLLVGMTGLTLVLLWLSIRGRFRLRGLLVAAMLLVTLTSFRPMKNAEKPSIDDVGTDEPRVDLERPSFDPIPTPTPEPAPFAVEVAAPEQPEQPEQPESPEPRTVELHFNTDELPPALQQIGLPPEVNVQITVPSRMMLDREELRASIREFRLRVREEARRRQRRR